jgi:hypothetical protein
MLTIISAYMYVFILLCLFYGLFSDADRVRRMVRGMVNWKGFRRKRLWPNQGTISAFTCRD